MPMACLSGDTRTLYRPTFSPWTSASILNCLRTCCPGATVCAVVLNRNNLRDRLWLALFCCQVRGLVRRLRTLSKNVLIPLIYLLPGVDCPQQVSIFQHQNDQNEAALTKLMQNYKITTECLCDCLQNMPLLYTLDI